MTLNGIPVILDMNSAYCSFSDYTVAILGDLHQFDSVTLTWTELGADKVFGDAPSARSYAGMTASDSRLFVYGGAAAGSESVGGKGRPIQVGDILIFLILACFLSKAYTLETYLSLM